MKVAFVFPGQGSQSVGMLGAYDRHPVVRSVVAEASDVLGQDLWSLVESGPQEELNQTVNTQPIMLAADVAVFRAWKEAGGVMPAIMAGHSLGEYAALVAGGALELKDALPLVRYRAEVMQEAVPRHVGAMAVVMGLDNDEVEASCFEARNQGDSNNVVEAVNYNGPGQVVIAGHRGAVQRAMEVAKAKGAKRCVLLPVSAPFHSSLLRLAADKLAAYLEKVPFMPPHTPVVHNVDVTRAQSPYTIRNALALQAAKPVRWTETIESIATEGVAYIVECGPGKVLTGLNRRISPGSGALSLVDSASIDTALATTGTQSKPGEADA